MAANKRPFGVGLLVVGCDELGTHLYQTSPSAEYFEYYVSIELPLGIFNWRQVTASKNLLGKEL